MNVIGHPHISMNRQTMCFCRLDQGIAEEQIVRIKRKHRLPIITALNDVLRLAWDDESGKAGHGEQVCYWVDKIQE